MDSPPLIADLRSDMLGGVADGVTFGLSCAKCSELSLGGWGGIVLNTAGRVGSYSMLEWGIELIP
jgi:hypothetical protein